MIHYRITLETGKYTDNNIDLRVTTASVQAFPACLGADHMFIPY